MSKVLLCWELGDGLGHLLPLATIAQRLHERGHKVVFIIRDLANSVTALNHLGHCWYPAPSIRTPLSDGAPNCHPSLLVANGYGTPSNLIALMTSWENIFNLHQPDYVLSDSSITASLVARRMRIPELRIGSGFFDPNPEEKLPVFAPWKGVPVERTLEYEAQCLNSINQAFTYFGLSAVHSVNEIYKGNVLYRTWKETNPFGPHSPDSHIGGIETSGFGDDPIWKDAPGEKTFIYLKNSHPSSLGLTTQMAMAGFNISAFLSGFDKQMYGHLEKMPNVHIHQEPVNISCLKDDVKLVVTHGGNVMNNALSEGRRVLSLPLQVEQHLTAMQASSAKLPVVIIGPGLELESSLKLLLAKPLKTLPKLEDNIGFIINKLLTH